MTDDLLNLAKDVISRARRLGADSGDALAIDAQGTDIEMREGEIEKLERTESRGVGLRVFVGQSSALISGSVFTPESLNRLAETAVAMARATPPDSFAGLAPRELLAKDLPKLDLVSSYLPESDRLKALALGVEGAALAVSGRDQVRRRKRIRIAAENCLGDECGIWTDLRTHECFAQCFRHCRRRHGDGARL